MEQLFSSQNAAGNSREVIVPSTADIAAIQLVNGGTDTIEIEGTVDETNFFALELEDSNANGTVATSISADGIHRVRVLGLEKIRAVKTGTTDTVDLFIKFSYRR